MSLPVIAILTSSKCGHCVVMRGDGNPKEPKRNRNGKPLSHGKIKGGHHWSPTFFKKLIRGGSNDGNPKFRVFEFHFPTLGPRAISEASEISEFIITPRNKLTRLTYSPAKEGVYVQTDGGKKKMYDSKRGITFQGLSEKFPRDLLNFSYIYPGWVIADGKVWDDAVLGINHLYAKPLSCYVKEEEKNGKRFWRVDVAKGYTELVDPIEFIKNLGPGYPSLKIPPKEEEKESKDEEKRENRIEGCRYMGYKISPA